MTFKFAIGALLAAINKRLCLEKGINNTVLLEQCERLSCWGDRSTRILTVFGKRPGSAKVVDPGHAQ